MRALKYFLVYAVNHKAIVDQLDFIAAFLQAKVKNRVFVKSYIRYTDYFSEYLGEIGIALGLLNSMYGMTNSGKLFSDELTECFLEAVFIQYQYHMSIYYKYALDGTNSFFKSHVYDCVYWYTYEDIGNGLWTF